MTSLPLKPEEIAPHLLQVLYKLVEGDVTKKVHFKKVITPLYRSLGLKSDKEWGPYIKGNVKTTEFIRRMSIAWKNVLVFGDLGIANKGYWQITEKGKQVVENQPPKGTRSEILLVPLEISHAPDLLSFINDHEVTKNFRDLNSQITLEEEEAWVQDMIRSETDEVWAIQEMTTHTIIGIAGIHQIYHPSKSGRLGIILDKSYHNKGYGQKVISQLVAKGFNHLDLQKIWLVFFRTNDRMFHITTKMGFEWEGVLKREYVDHEGKYHDMVRVCILRDEL